MLRRHGFSRLADADRVTGAPVRYVACHPGALLHQDHTKLGRNPDGGGEPSATRYHGYRKSGLGYDHFEVFVDDASRLARVVPVPDERPAATVKAVGEALTWFASRGIRVERVQPCQVGSTSTTRDTRTRRCSG